MIRSAVLVATLTLAACAGHTPPAACRGEVFALNPSLTTAAPAPGAGPVPVAAR